MILGIDLGGTNIRIGQIEGAGCSEGGELIAKISEPSPSQMTLEESLEYLKIHIRKMMTPAVESIGIGVPSVVDVTTGVVYNVTNIPSWKEVPLKAVLEKEFCVPVYINNDANCFALGEKEFGLGKAYRDIVGITLGTGVGAGLIINNTLYGGRNTGAGEVASLPYLDANLERYCSSEFFIYKHDTTGKLAAEKARAGEAEALKMWDEFGGHIGNLVQATLFTFDPELIIFGGGIAGAYPLFERAMHEKMTEFPYPETIKNIRIEVSTNGDIGILGAAAVAKHRISTY